VVIYDLEVLMTPYVQQYVSSEEQVIFNRIREAIALLPDIDLGVDEKGEEIVLSCHMLARAVAKIFHLKVVDGYFARFYNHSWLVTPKGHVIDIYPVGMLGGPMLVDATGVLSPGGHLYKQKNPRAFARGQFSKNSFRRSVRRITRALTNILENKATT
jgi:hypothetical protein